VIVGAALALPTTRLKVCCEVAPQLSVAVTVIVYVPTGPGLVIVTTPVVVSTDKLPVKPALAEAVMDAIDPLSVGAALGDAVLFTPVVTLVVLYVPCTGAVLAVTFTVKLPFVLKAPSLTLKPTVFAPTVAEQAATTSLVIVPVVLTMFDTVKPAGTVGAVTVNVPAALSASATTAIWLLLVAEPA
jgi:hypothetical protein